MRVCGSVLCFQPFARTRESVTVRMLHNEKVIGAGKQQATCECSGDIDDSADVLLALDPRVRQRHAKADDLYLLSVGPLKYNSPAATCAMCGVSEHLRGSDEGESALQ